MTALNPGEIRDELDELIASAEPIGVRRFEAGGYHHELSDETLVGYDPEPGWLVIDGERMYSAAWL